MSARSSGLSTSAAIMLMQLIEMMCIRVFGCSGMGSEDREIC